MHGRSILFALAAFGLQLCRPPHAAVVALSADTDPASRDDRPHLTLVTRRGREVRKKKIKKKKKKKKKPGKKKKKNPPGKNNARPGRSPQKNTPPKRNPSRPTRKPSRPSTSIFVNYESSESEDDPGVTPERTPEPTPPPTGKPEPAPKPTERPKPTPKPTEKPKQPPPPAPAPVPPSRTEQRVYDILDSKRGLIDNSIFLYQGQTPSTVYRYEGFLAGLQVMVADGVAGKRYYLGDDSERGHLYGLANIAAFLGQSMKETIQYDACDENNWDFYFENPLVVYPLANACGQLEQSYQDYHCPEHERHMECKVDKDMSLRATTHAKWYGAPGPFFCGPTSEYEQVGIWDYTFACDNKWADPPLTCDVYEGQRSGRYDNSKPVKNRNGRTDVEGCCWWGRGVIQTTGICNFGKLNYYLGARAAAEGRGGRYPDVDFCADPGIICASDEHKELKWIAGMFYWIESLQSYDERGWNYMDELHKFVDGGMVDHSFINGVSGVVNRGCHDPPCGTGPVDGAHERAGNFNMVLTLLNS